jgi:hypothetical protein
MESTLWLPQETAARDKTMILSCRNANNMLLQVKIQMTTRNTADHYTVNIEAFTLKKRQLFCRIINTS